MNVLKALNAVQENSNTITPASVIEENTNRARAIFSGRAPSAPQNRPTR